MRVDSYDTYGKAGFFNPETGALQEVERSEADLRETALRGHFAYIGGSVVVFYRLDDDLLLWLSGHAWHAASPLVSWSKEGSESCLTVQGDGGTRVQIKYQVEVRDQDDPTPFAEEEDWDFGLYVINVLNDPLRRERIYR
jgi:hypothetical protein